MGKPDAVRVSVIIPTHNRAVYVLEAVASVLAQSYPHFEVIVVDDGSTDATPQALAAIGDPRVRVVRLSGNCGPATARNAGICHAAGDLIAFLDDDDAYYPYFLVRVVEVMERAGPDVGFCWCGIRAFRGTLDEAHRLEDRVRLIPSFSDRDQAFRHFWTATQPGTGYGLTVRKACFGRVGLFDPALHTSQDTDLLLRLVRAYDYVAIPDVLVQVREHDGLRRSLHWAARASAVDRMYTKHAASLQRYPHLCAGWLTYSGMLYFRSGQAGMARRRMVQAAALAPTNIRTWRLWAAHEWHYGLRS